MSATTGRPSLPCQAGPPNQEASLAASGGSSWTRALTSRLGAGLASVSVTFAVTGLPPEIGVAHATTATAPTIASGRAKRGPGRGGISGELSARPMKPPITPPDTAATKPQTIPSSSMLEGHEIVHQA